MTNNMAVEAGTLLEVILLSLASILERSLGGRALASLGCHYGTKVHRPRSLILLGWGRLLVECNRSVSVLDIIQTFSNLHDLG